MNTSSVPRDPTNSRLPLYKRDDLVMFNICDIGNVMCRDNYDFLCPSKCLLELYSIDEFETHTFRVLGYENEVNDILPPKTFLIHNSFIGDRVWWNAYCLGYDEVKKSYIKNIDKEDIDKDSVILKEIMKIYEDYMLVVTDYYFQDYTYTKNNPVYIISEYYFPEEYIVNSMV